MQYHAVGVKKALLIGVTLLSACSPPGSQDDSKPQHWRDLDVQVQTRPSPPRAGMSEVLVLMNGSRGYAKADCLVDLRSADQDEWKQAIEDGLVGVYRRAIDLEPGERSVIQVQLRCHDERGVLRFPVAFH